MNLYISLSEYVTTHTDVTRKMSSEKTTQSIEGKKSVLI